MPGRKPPGESWAPDIGAETRALIEHLENLGLPRESGQRVVGEARAILARCLPPAITQGAEAGLAIGYVQSGKTMSFTTVSALARDNEYNLVIIIAGTSVYLLQQSTDRLMKDLRLNIRPDRKWRHFQSSKLGRTDKTSIRDTLAEWDDPTVPSEMRRTILITAMKHHGHLEKVANVLPDDLRHVRALIIDDEGDQASLNAAVNKGPGVQSTTYSRIVALRHRLPHHTYIQYTATPQAPLLINIIDLLSPRFAELLTPGEGYIGGKRLFLENPRLVVEIPPEENPSEGAEIVDPPKSLHEAMQIYFVGVAAGLVKDGGAGNRSMLVHPSQHVASHDIFFQWVVTAREAWNSILDIKRSMPDDRKELLEEFKVAYRNLSRTVPDIPSWPEIEERLHHAVRSTRVEKINATPGAADEINWRDAYSFILVGGQAMDRGFTVEGLTVTYMPRRVGVGNADTLQQRGRFFGYKRGYLGYCRIYLGAGTKDAFTKYVKHEEDVRNRLLQHRATGKPLAEWKRAFLLDRSLRPTRKSVLDLDYMRGAPSASWYVTDRPHADLELAKENLDVVESFFTSIRRRLKEDAGSRERTKYQRHDMADVPMKMLLEDCLSRMRFADPNDSQQFTLLTILLAEVLAKKPEANCTVFKMSKWEPRERGLDGKDKIKNLFMGAAPVNPPPMRGTIYRGDREVAIDRGGFVMQFHRLRLTKEIRGKTVRDANLVPAIAFYASEGLGADLVIQEQPAQKRTR